MIRDALPPADRAHVARKAREQFVRQAQACLAPMGQAIRARLIELAQTPAGAREMQERRDAMCDFARKAKAFLEGTGRGWARAVNPPAEPAPVRVEAHSLELVGEDVVERKILSSRLALTLQEKAVWELNDLKVRMQHLDGHPQAPSDILRPETLCLLLVEQWSEAGLSHATWQSAQDVLRGILVDAIPNAYKATNEFLIAQNVMRDIDLSTRVQRTPAGSAAAGAGRGLASNAQEPLPQNARMRDSAPAGLAGGHDDTPATTWGGHSAPGGLGAPDVPAGRHRADVLAAGGSEARASNARGSGPASQPGTTAATFQSPARSGPGTVSDETRMLTSSPPLARARARATGVLAQLKRLLIERVPSFEGSAPMHPSPALAEALQPPVQRTDTLVQAASTVQDISVYDNAAVNAAATDLRRRTGELKRRAETSTEKATIEIVALMFQSILAEERIPPAVRVWFARLQMPVLRVALAEPEFFGTLEHPARQLIDHMGSCVMGFDATAISGTALELEIKRVVQVIEQYPETGRRVFQLVYDEFQRFLSRYLTQKRATQKLVSVAQQVEQKDTLAIRYTIELRTLLDGLPVRAEIRDFLFKVWAEVLAVAAVRHGPQHADTLALKAAASELVWAASAKPNRAERAKVIQDLPRLLQRLRQGMTMIGTVGAAQEAHIRSIGDTLADAFQSKTEAIPHERIDGMAQRLAHLEDFVAADPATDVPLDRESIEMMLGIDASMIEVLADGGTRPSAAMLAWSAELQPGNWFTLDHNGVIAQVQYVWRSERRQLHLFATAEGRSYLVQARRMAAYLQAGLLLPSEDEALTVRATREALAKLDANPERLLQ